MCDILISFAIISRLCSAVTNKYGTELRHQFWRFLLLIAEAKAFSCVVSKNCEYEEIGTVDPYQIVLHFVSNVVSQYSIPWYDYYAP